MGLTPNITTVLGFIGDDAAVVPLIDFVRGQDSDTEWSTAVYQGRASAIPALGYLVNKSGNAKAMKYLLKSVDPQIWIEREIPWLIARENEERLRVRLSTSAVLGLALTGTIEAELKLHELLNDEGTHSRIRHVAESVLPHLTKGWYPSKCGRGTLSACRHGRQPLCFELDATTRPAMQNCGHGSVTMTSRATSTSSPSASTGAVRSSGACSSGGYSNRRYRWTP